MTYEEWEGQIPEAIKTDSLWKMQACRLGLLLSDLAWYDATKLIQDQRTLKLSGQLYTAVGSISANLAEGYSMGTGKNRARFYEYSLGSARESRDWYYKSRHVLRRQVVSHRMALLEQIIPLLLTMIPQQRGRTLHEDGGIYATDSETLAGNVDLACKEVSVLLRDMPLP